MALGQKAEARQRIDQVLAPAKIPEALLQDAVLKMGQKDYAGARASAEGALSQNPEDVRALNVLMQSYSAQNQVQTGLQKVREHASKEPSSAAVQQYLGQLLAATGDRAGARKAFEAAKAAKPGLVTADLALAEMDAIEGKRDDARKRLSAVVAAHPDNIPAVCSSPNWRWPRKVRGGPRGLPQSGGIGRKQRPRAERRGVPAGRKQAAG